MASRTVLTPERLLLSKQATGYVFTRSTTIPSARDHKVQARKAAKHRNRQEA